MRRFFVGLFDRIIHKYFLRNYKLRRTFLTDINLKKRFYHKKKNEVLYVNIPGWRTNFSDSKLFRNRVIDKGFSYLSYEFPEGILSWDAKMTEKDFLKIRRIIRHDLQKYFLKYHFKKIVVVGMSLGVVLALMVANKNKLVKKIVLIVPGYDLAESLWTGISTKNLRNKFEKEGINLGKLINLWKKLSPSNNINSLDGKEIFVFLSEADQVINYSQGNKLLGALKKRYKVNFKINKNLGHYLTCYFAYSYYGFLND